MAPAEQKLPTKMRQIQVKSLGTDFRKHTEIVEVPVPSPGAGEALVRIRYVGVNASDILYSNGSYLPGVPPPYAAGLEGMGEVVQIGEGSKLKVGQIVMALTFGSFSDYVVLKENEAVPVPSLNPAFLSLGVSGTTASLALEKKGNLNPNETVLVTGAAGGTGQFAIQLAKLSGCRTIGTCSSQEKAEFLKTIGCDRPIIYTKENLGDVLQKEYPNGVDVVYECIGNEIFDTCLKNIAQFGRIIVIGAISAYQGPGTPADKIKTTLPVPLMTLQKSADIRGFLLLHYIKDIPAHIEILARYHATGQIKVFTDDGSGAPNGPFDSLEKVYDAIDHMYASRNRGKVIVHIGKE